MKQDVMDRTHSMDGLKSHELHEAEWEAKVFSK